ncbi:MAG TPA: hypothetical protein VGV09_18655 [Steroidobacteraceae bacterium]|nr:hypothetical protein [Steroidobacteraceae bacterium]
MGIEFNRAVALLHSFALLQSEQAFAKVAAEDPECAMAYWGIAMSHANQVNGGPAASDLGPARQALERADAAKEKDSREAAYIRALHALFDGFKADDFYKLAGRYTDSMAQVAATYPKDIEAQVFYALALLNSDRPDDVALANPRKAVAILQPLFRQFPDHPGIAHYIIHATDNPKMAQAGLEAARHYSKIAPAVPHALHMPGHIFARLGLWSEDISANLASKAAAENRELHAGPENRLHAMEFLEYAYLQTGQIAKARAIVNEAKSIKVADLDPRYTGYYATVETRYGFLLAVETRDWAAAAATKPVVPGDKGADGLALLANAMAAGHQHDAPGAKRAEASVDALVAKITPSQRPTATLPDEIRAWDRFAQGRTGDAMALLRPIADRQASIGKGEVEIPAREMLADMLLLDRDYAGALAQFQLSLAADPNRFSALIGTVQAAEKLGDRAVADRYFRILSADCRAADTSVLERVEKLNPRVPL